MKSMIDSEEDSGDTAATTNSQVPSPSTKPVPANIGLSQKIPGDLVEAKSHAGGHIFRGGECYGIDNDNISTCEVDATVSESKEVLFSPLRRGCVDSVHTGIEVAKAAVRSRHHRRIDDRCDDVNFATRESSNMDTDGNANTPSRSPTSLTRPIPRKKKRRLQESFHGESNGIFIDNEEEETDMPVDISLNQLKRQVLGRDLKVDGGENDCEGEDEDDAEIREIRDLMKLSDTNSDGQTTPETGFTIDKDNGCKTIKDWSSTNPRLLSLPEKLRNDLICAICHEIVYPPVALPCGHSFCQPCIDWWFNHDDAGRCPTCRRRSHSQSHTHNRRSAVDTSPNLALRACVMTMFGPEIVLRLQNRKKMRPRGENGGAHNAGYQMLSEIRDETWHYVAVRTDGDSDTNSSVQVRRSIVLDAEDQRMQLALAIYHGPIKNEVLFQNNIENLRGSCGRFCVELCLLTMEEDEAVDSGFPTNVISPEDEFFLCGGNHGSSRFKFSYLDVQMRDENKTLSPLARVSADTNDGRFKYVLDPAESAGNASTDTIRTLFFVHSETGLQLEIDLYRLQKRTSVDSSLLFDQIRPNVVNYRRDLCYSNERYIDTDEDDGGESQCHFEEEEVLVGDGESSVKATFSDEEGASIDEYNTCIICKEGGELMVCDGGDKNPGCGKCFHAGCVHRSSIPRGDWICQACAKAGDIETDIAGHEFREPDESSYAKRDELAPQHDVSSDLGDDDVDDYSDFECVFSDGNQSDSRSQKELESDDEDVLMLRAKQNCEDKSTTKLLSKSNKISTKHRFVLEDSDSE